MNQLPPDVLDALRRGEPIEAMKLLRKASGLSLRDARQAIDRNRNGVVAERGRDALRSAAAASMPVRGEHVRAPRPGDLSPGEVPRRGGLRLAAIVALVLLAAWLYLKRG